MGRNAKLRRQSKTRPSKLRSINKPKKLSGSERGYEGKICALCRSYGMDSTPFLKDWALHQMNFSHTKHESKIEHDYGVYLSIKDWIENARKEESLAKCAEGHDYLIVFYDNGDLDSAQRIRDAAEMLFPVIAHKHSSYCWSNDEIHIIKNAGALLNMAGRSPSEGFAIMQSFLLGNIPKYLWNFIDKIWHGIGEWKC